MKPLACVLEAGCGDAHTLRAVLDRYPNLCIDATGFDWAQAAVDRAKALVPEALIMKRDLFRSGTGDEDIVLCVEVLEHLTDYNTAIERLLDLCVPGGHLFVTVPNGDRDTYEGHVNHWMPDTLFEVLSNHRRGDDKHIETGFFLDGKFVYGVLQA